MNNPNNPKLGHNKKTFLEKPIEHIDITSFDSRKIVEAMDKMSFTSRDTAKATNIFNEKDEWMLNKLLRYGFQLVQFDEGFKEYIDKARQGIDIINTYKEMQKRIKGSPLKEPNRSRHG